MTHRVDVHVGRRVRLGRFARGVSQQQLAESVGVSFQQIQKYETGDNRVSASRLWDIAKALGVPVSFFFEGMDAAGQGRTPWNGLSDDVVNDREALELLRSFYAIPELQRRELLNLSQALASTA
jgi:transcriptional regulator with XRE-family HTH domain